MRSIFLQVACILTLILVLTVTGCVAPPEEVIKPPTENGGIQNVTMVTVTTTSEKPDYLPDVTLYQTIPTPTMAYSVFVSPTTIPEDQVCLIDLSTHDWRLQANSTATSFNLKNPPLYINYTITKPFNVSGTKVVFSSNDPLKTEETKVPYTYYSPYSYLEITVRNSQTGNIYAQDGFGKNYGYLLNKTIRVSNTADMLIEIKGFNVTPTIGIWAKPIDNLDESINVSKLECRSQDYVMRLNQ